jgi:tetratricopeptide (TPR) repeat protein
MTSFIAVLIAGLMAMLAQDPAPPLYEGLGAHHHEITTSSARAQAYFDQGLRLTYAFNHGEAIRSFREAARLDSTCAMCAWGIAYAYGPNINAAMDSASGVAAYEAVQRAARLAVHASPKEQAFIEALQTRYAPVPRYPRASLDSAYANAMARVAAAYPDDDDAQVLSAEALLDLSPWVYWTEDAQPRPNGARAQALLTRVIARNDAHAGACHYYIHAVEAKRPELALPCAERLPALMPAAGHVVHMPAHIYIRVGRYADAVERNVHAVHADEKYIEDQSPDGLYRLGYYPHNYHFLWYAAAMAGRSEQAIEAAQQAAEQTPREGIGHPAMGGLQQFVVTPYFALMRFGRWQELLDAPTPTADVPYMRGLYSAALGMARLRTGDAAGAQAELARVEDVLAAHPELAQTWVWEGNSAQTVVRIGLNVLAGEIAADAGDYDAAIRALQTAVAIDDALIYDEPPSWPIAVRHNLGAVLLAAGRPADAERVYREDLGEYPQNGWSLYGLAQALRAQGRTAAAAAVERELATAWAGADVTLTASRF